MFARIKWTPHLVDLFVVFIGVTAAFMLESWRADNQENQLEEKYLNSLYKDISTDLTKLDSVVSFNQQALRQTNQLMTILKADRLQSDSIGLLMATMAQSELFRPITSTYESIKSSGNLGVISNYNLKETIVKYYQYYEYSRVLEEVSERFINQYIFPFFYENFDMMSGDFINRERLNDIKFRNLIVGYRGMTAQNLEFYKEVRAACKDLQGQLATELKKTGLFTPQNSLTGK